MRPRPARIKRLHGRIEGLDPLMDQIIHECPHVTRIIPGRMGRKRGNTEARLRVQYPTSASTAVAGR